MQGHARHILQTFGYKTTVRTPLRPADDAVPPVGCIVKNRETMHRSVHPDLMGSARFQVKFHEAYGAPIFDSTVMGHRRLAASVVGVPFHPLTIGRIPIDGSPKGPAGLGTSPNQGLIGTLDAVIKKLSGQMGHGAFFFGHHQKTRGILVDAMNQTRP